MFNQTIKQIELNSQFSKAIDNNDIEKVKDLFAEGKEATEIPFLDFEMGNSTGIMVAAQNANWDMVGLLYMLGADTDVRIMPQKWYLINECITNAPDKVSKAIIDESNINVQNNKGETPLMIAIKRQKGIMADYLLESGRVDLVLCNNEQENAAHYAARHGQHDLFLKLVAKGVPLLKKNKEGKTPIDLIEDENFRLSLPVHFETISNEGGGIVLQDSDIEEKEDKKEDILVKKVSGLSSIKKKVS